MEENEIYVKEVSVAFEDGTVQKSVSGVIIDIKDLDEENTSDVTVLTYNVSIANLLGAITALVKTAAEQAGLPEKIVLDWTHDYINHGEKKETKNEEADDDN